MEGVTPKKEVDVNSPEIQRLMNEIMSQSEAIKKREELSEKSFHAWFCEVLQKIGEQMGYIIRNIYDIPADWGYSFGKGFKEGMEKAKQNSYRARDRMNDKH